MSVRGSKGKLSGVLITLIMALTTATMALTTAMKQLVIA